MPYCVNCGQQLSEKANFCTECGENVNQITIENDKQRTTIYDGEIHKCPNCGETLKSFVSNCPSCGFEIRGKMATSSVLQFYCDINNITSSEQKDNLIRNFPIPNTKEDILEFLILASSNVIGEDDKNIFEAWTAKFEQGYNKARLLFGGDGDFFKIQHIYDEFQTNVSNEKANRINKFTINTITRNIVVCVGVILMIVAVVIDLTGGDSILIVLASGIALIASAASLAKRGASLIDYGVGALSALALFVLSFLLYNGSASQLFGGIVLVVVAVNYFKNAKQNSK